MSNKTMLDGSGLFLVNLGAGFATAVFAYFLSTLIGTLGSGSIYLWCLSVPFLALIFAFLFWLLQTILIWIWRSRSDKRVLVIGFLAIFCISFAPYLLNIYVLRLWEGHWSLFISGGMLIGSLVLATMRMQLWREQEMLEKAQREDSL